MLSTNVITKLYWMLLLQNSANLHIHSSCARSTSDFNKSLYHSFWSVTFYWQATANSYTFYYVKVLTVI